MSEILGGADRRVVSAGKIGVRPDARARVAVTHPERMIELPVGPELWERVFSRRPLVLVGTSEGDGWDFAPKHMAMPLGWEGFYCFVCTPEHATYRNLTAVRFTVSFPRPEQIVEASFAGGRPFRG